MVQRPLLSAISRNSILLESAGLRRKIMPPAVGSRTTSLIAGRLTSFLKLWIGLGLFNALIFLPRLSVLRFFTCSFLLIAFCFLLIARRFGAFGFFISQDRSQHAVYELGRVITAKGFGQFDSFIDSHFGRHIGRKN